MQKEYVLITGSTSGIGYELCKIFAQNRYNLIIHGRDKNKVEKLRNELLEYNISLHMIVGDLLKEENIKNLCTYIKKNNLKIKYLINNAGVGSFGPFYEIDLKKDLDIIDINIRSLTYLTKLIIPFMIKKNEGGILNVASTAAFSPGPYMNVYYASKVYVLYFSEALREELKEIDINVSVLCPGATKTNFQRNATIRKPKLVERNLMDPKKVAQVAYKNFIKGKKIIIPGFINKLTVIMSKILPTKLVVFIIKKTNYNN